jgi:hypothetical protein
VEERGMSDLERRVDFLERRVEFLETQAIDVIGLAELLKEKGVVTSDELLAAIELRRQKIEELLRRIQEPPHDYES